MTHPVYIIISRRHCNVIVSRRLLSKHFLLAVISSYCVTIVRTIIVNPRPSFRVSVE